MKLKRVPEDFRVEELSSFEADGGEYALYRLTKTSLGTPEAIDVILRQWRLPRDRVHYGGLKDKHALTTQFVTIRHGKRQNLAQKNLQVTYLGQTSRDFTPKDIEGNRFEIVMRDMSAEEIERAVTGLEAVQRCGLPNYFDDQRFGSVGESGEFIAQAWCAGNYERALWLTLADPHPDDKADEREQKRLLRQHWGNWRQCKEVLARSNRRSVITFLADKPVDQPADFKRAFALIRTDMRGLYLAAFQSFLWNQMLAACLRQSCEPNQLCEVSLQMGPAPFVRELRDEQRQRLQSLLLPLPSARLHDDDLIGQEEIKALIDGVLAPLGLERRQLRVKYPRDSFFSKGERLAVIPIPCVTHAIADDDLYPGRQKLALGFDLPRGSYATMLVKRLTEVT